MQFYDAERLEPKSLYICFELSIQLRQSDLHRPHFMHQLHMCCLNTSWEICARFVVFVPGCYLVLADLSIFSMVTRAVIRLRQFPWFYQYQRNFRNAGKWFARVFRALWYNQNSTTQPCVYHKGVLKVRHRITIWKPFTLSKLGFWIRIFQIS